MFDAEKSARTTIQHLRARQARNSKWVTDENGIVHVPLTRGLEALIDECDKILCSNFSWRARESHNNGSTRCFYAEATVPGQAPKCIFLHNLIMGANETGLYDHIDRDGLNCVRSNLRPATRSQNASNRASFRSVRPYRGVFRQRDCSSWVAQVMVNGKYRKLGGFKTSQEAAFAYNKMANDEFGEFATLNPVGE